MHEMSICQGLISQVESIARDKGASQVDSIVLSIGPADGSRVAILSGQVPHWRERLSGLAALEPHDDG